VQSAVQARQLCQVSLYGEIERETMILQASQFLAKLSDTILRRSKLGKQGLE
jgi:hypothetical protein